MQGLSLIAARESTHPQSAYTQRHNGRKAFSARLASWWAWLVCPAVFLFSYIPILNPYSRGILLLFISWFFYAALSIQKKIHTAPPIIAFLAWIFFALLMGAFVAVDMESAINRWVTIFTTGLLSLAVLNAVAWSGSIRSWAWAFILSALLAYASSYLPIGHFVVSEYETEIEGRVVGTLANANTFGRAMTQAFLIGLGLLLVYRLRGWQAAIVWSAMGILVFGVIESNSRTAMLGLLVAILAVFHGIGWRKLISPMRLVMFTGAIGIVVGIITTFPDRFSAALNRMMILGGYLGVTPQVETRERSVEERADLANAVFDIFSDHPFGIGLDNFRLIAGKYAHSNYLEVLVSTGLAGLLIYYAGLIWMGAAILQSKRKVRNPAIRKFVLWTIACIAILDISNVSYYAKTYWVFLGLVCGIYVLAAQNKSGVQ